MTLEANLKHVKYMNNETIHSDQPLTKTLYAFSSFLCPLTIHIYI